MNYNYGEEIIDLYEPKRGVGIITHPITSQYISVKFACYPHSTRYYRTVINERLISPKQLQTFKATFKLPEGYHKPLS